MQSQKGGLAEGGTIIKVSATSIGVAVVVVVLGVGTRADDVKAATLLPPPAALMREGRDVPQASQERNVEGFISVHASQDHEGMFSFTFDIVSS